MKEHLYRHGNPHCGRLPVGGLLGMLSSSVELHLLHRPELWDRHRTRTAYSPTRRPSSSTWGSRRGCFSYKQTNKNKQRGTLNRKCFNKAISAKSTFYSPSESFLFACVLLRVCCLWVSKSSYLPVFGLGDPSVLQLVHQSDPAVPQVLGHRVRPGQLHTVAHLIAAGVCQHVGQVDRRLCLH